MIDSGYALWPHQQKAEAFLTGASAILWHEMRLGKTRSTLHAHNQLLNGGVVRDLVVVTVASAMETWRDEIDEMGLSVPYYTCYGQTRQRMEPELPGAAWEPLPRIYILNWEILSHWQRFFHAHYKQGREFNLVLDEGHLYLRNPLNQRYKAARWLSRFAKRTWELTGTLYAKSGMDIFWQLQLMGRANPFRWMDKDDFGKEFCNRRFNPFKGPRGGWEWTGLKNEQALVAQLPCVSALRIGDVAPEIPVPDQIPRWVADWGDYWLANRTDLELAKEIQAMIPRKAKLTVEYVQDLDIRPVVIFGWNVDFTERVATALHAPRIYGETSLADRASIRRSFQAGRLPILVGNYRSLGMGVSLSQCDDFVYGEPYWDASLYLQAQARGLDLQKRRRLRHHHLLVKGSPDEHIWVVRLDRGRAIERLYNATASQSVDLNDEEAM